MPEERKKWNNTTNIPQMQPQNDGQQYVKAQPLKYKMQKTAYTHTHTHMFYMQALKCWRALNATMTINISMGYTISSTENTAFVLLQ